MWPGGGEPARFAAGDGPSVLEVDGRRLGLGICRDTGVPEQVAATAALGMDVYAAGVLEHEADASVTDERARRIAAGHGVWVAIASFAGGTGDGYTRAAGRSGVWAPGGRLVTQAGPEPDAIVHAAL
jgi:predicted amidohydrolase